MRTPPPSSNATSAPLVIDTEEQTLRRFRSTRALPPIAGVERRGLDAVSCSGSAQLSADGWRGLLRALAEQGAEDVYVINLRQEPHGFLNGAAVSWYAQQNWASAGLSPEEAAQREALQLRLLSRSERVAVARIEDVKRGGPAPTTERRCELAQSEEELLALPPGRYRRVPVLDHTRPGDEVLDRFLRFARELDPRAHLHFHCRGGKGRTATFMAIMDMIHNAHRLPLDVILERQRQLNDYDFHKAVDPASAKAPYLRDRLEMLSSFHEFARRGETDWRAWALRS